MITGNAKKSLLDQTMDGNKPILMITHGHTLTSDMIIVIRSAFIPCLEFLLTFTGSVQQIITPSDSSVDVTLLRRTNVVTAVSCAVQFPDSQLQPYYLNVKPPGGLPYKKDGGAHRTI